MKISEIFCLPLHQGNVMAKRGGLEAWFHSQVTGLD